jgi:predicted DNA-binding transcriptional regulator AlpA
MPDELADDGVIISDGERYLSVERAAKYLGRKRSTVFGYVKQYGLKSRRFVLTGKRLFFRQSDLDALKTMSRDDPPKIETVAAA